MRGESDVLAAGYLSTGTLAGLPDRHFIDGEWREFVHGKPP